MVGKSLTITELEMLEALKRSGYMLESEAAQKLVDWGFFVQTGQVVEDPITGKGREIDIIANSFGNNNSHSDVRILTQIEYVFEVKNNLYPIVLLTEFRDSPYIESWTGLKERHTKPKDVKYHDYHEAYFERLIEKNKNIYTQYCSFHKKRGKDDLMASHPERFHESISKIILHCDDIIDERDNDDAETTFFRHFIYMPILLVRGELYELHENKLVEVTSSTLVTNYYHNSERKMAFVFVVTRDGFQEFMRQTQEMERDVAMEMADRVRNP